MLILYAVVVLLAVNLSFGCTPAKQGCYEHDNNNEYLLHSDKSEHTGEDYHSGKNVDWGNFEAYLKDAICRCEKAAAKRGFPYMSMRYFGVCHGLKTLPKKKSEFCIHHTFEQCMKDHDRCVGADDAEFIYKVTLKPASNPPPSLKVHRNIFCEHRGHRTISCGKGEVIKITKGYYGRTSLHHCGRRNWYNTACTSKSSVTLIPNACNGKQSCTLNPHNNIYGDPCIYTVKYLDIEHVCVPTPKKVFMCEHRGARTISCGAGEKIEIINGYYGRQSRSPCWGVWWYNTKCKATTSRQKIENACNGRQSCRLNPHNAIYGDPCKYTVKYIEVDYRCVKS